MHRRTFLRSAAASLVLGGWPWRARAAGQPDEGQTLDQAREGIARHRQGSVGVAVLDADGRPAMGVAVKVEQVRHEFLFGCNGFHLGQLRDPALDHAYRQRLAELCNCATLGFYWAQYEPRRGEPRHPHMDDAVGWCRAQGMVCQGHPLVWASLPDPDWLPEDFGEIYALSHGRVREIVSRFQGRFDVWHVVNEPTLLSWARSRFARWAQHAGTVPYAAGYLRTARQADPTATLLVNDCLTEVPYLPLLDQLRDADGRLLFDGVGIQSHMHVTRWSPGRAWSVCDDYASLGLPLHFTEVTVLSGGGAEGRWLPTSAEGETAQADYVERFYTVLFGHAAVRSISWWDLSDLGAWKGAAAGLLRRDMSPKPAYDRLRDLIKRQWWTRASGETGSAGEFRCRAFHGRHRVVARAADGREAAAEFSSGPRRRNRVELVLPRW